MKKFLSIIISIFFPFIQSICAEELGYQSGIKRIQENSLMYSSKDFSNLIGKMEGFSDALLKLHFSLYEGYVKNTNELLATLNSFIDQGKERTIAFMALKRRLGWEFDGMVLHELYFENLGGAKSLSSSSPLYRKIVEDFGSFQRWKEDFIATGLIRGIGWVILYQDPKEGHLINTWINEHDVGHLAGGKPILVMDVWEHAYITEYGLNRSGYIDAFFKNIRWDIVEGRLNK